MKTIELEKEVLQLKNELVALKRSYIQLLALLDPRAFITDVDFAKVLMESEKSQEPLVRDLYEGYRA